MTNIHFIIGANGVGKTSIIPHLQIVFGDGYAVHDFDERGVPDNADKEWRRTETLYWLETAKHAQSEGVSTVIVGFAKPAEIDAATLEVGYRSVLSCWMQTLRPLHAESLADICLRVAHRT